MASSNLLEYYHNSVTPIVNEDGSRYEISKCRCGTWFCPDCAAFQGYKLRARLIPILQNFTGLIMVSLTIDPELFPDPKTAYLYTMDKRCISVTTQDLFRWQYLFTRRYFYVVEWQQNTQQAHYHVLYDSCYIPFEQLLMSWSKHRPKDTGLPKENRPAFGTVIFSKKDFASPVHAASYATKYLIKIPEYGFPEWVLGMGKDRRVRRYSTSKGFWGTPTTPPKQPKIKRPNTKRTYLEKLTSCGDSINVFEVNQFINPETGEVENKPTWIGQVNVPSDEVIPELFDPGNPERNRRTLLATDKKQVRQIIENTSGHKMEWLRTRAAIIGGN